MNTRLKPENAGTLDPAFADAGKLKFPLDGLPDIESAAVLALPDKKTLVGFYPFDLFGSATVARFHEDGTLDTGFGGGKGFVVIALENAIMAHVVGLSLLQDGAWLLRGTYQQAGSVEGIALVRCLPDGQQDPSFGEEGVCYLRFDEMDKPELIPPGNVSSGPRHWKRVRSSRATAGSGSSVTEQADGKIIVVSNVFDEFVNSNGIILRLNPDGSKDKTFNDHGFALVDFDNTSNTALGVATQPDGKVLVCGKYTDDTPGLQGGYLIRFDSSGHIDNSFNDGRAFTLKHRWVEFNDIAVREGDGRIVVVGAGAPMGALQGAIVVLNSNGSYNLVFNGGQPLFAPLQEAGVHWKKCVSQKDGAIVVAGNGSIRYINGGDTYIAARYRADGSLDPAFNGKGFYVFDDETMFCYYKDMNVLDDGRIVACGYYLLDTWEWVVVGGWATRLLG